MSTKEEIIPTEEEKEKEKANMKITLIPKVIIKKIIIILIKFQMKKYLIMFLMQKKMT